MENILHNFEEKVISLMTEFLKNSITVGGLSEFTGQLEENLMKLGYDLTKFSLEYAENIIFKLKERKEQYESLEKDNRKIVTIFGEIDFKRRYYLDKTTNERVHLQKGGIEEPSLIVVYDSIMKDGKRTKLCNKKHFGGVYTGRIDDLWEEVLTYIDNTYELDKVKNIYILGDGANWIKTGLEWLPKSINILDKFHLMKAVNGIVGKENKDNKQEKAEYKRRIYRSFYELNFEETKEIVYNKRKVIEFKEIEKIRHDAREKIKSSINFKVGKIPAMEFGTTEQRKFFKQLLEYKEVC